MTKANTNQTFASVWDAISGTPQEAANMKAKLLLLMALQKWLHKFDGTQKEAAVLLNISPQCLSDLKHSHIDLFSLDTLLNMADLAGIAPAVQLPIIQDTDIMSGTACFVGTRVPIQNMFDYLDAGSTREEFLIDFPSVSTESVQLLAHYRGRWPNLDTAIKRD